MTIVWLLVMFLEGQDYGVVMNFKPASNREECEMNRTMSKAISVQEKVNAAYVCVAQEREPEARR